MTNVVDLQMRGLSAAEIDAVAGGNPVGAFAAGLVVGVGLATGAVALVGGAILLAAEVSDQMKDDEPKTAPGTDENGNPIEE